MHLTHSYIFSDFPLAPENIQVAGDDLSSKAKEILIQLGRNPLNHKSTKLISHLGNRTNYIVHSANLQLYGRLGLRVTKIHRGLKFVSSPFLKPWIDVRFT